MVLKGGNRRWFEQWLLTNLDDALSAWPPEHRPAVRRRGGVLVLFTSRHCRTSWLRWPAT